MKSFQSYIYGFLRWTERYIKTDMVYVASSSFWINIGFASTSIIALIVSIAFAHLLPKDVFGVYQYVLSIAGLITAFSLTGINPTIARSVAKGNDGTLKASIPVQLCWGLISSAIALGMAGYYGSQGNFDLVHSMIIVAILLPISNTTNTYTAFLVGKKDFKNSFLYGLGTNLVYALVIIGTLFVTHNLLIVVGVYFLTTTLTNIACYYIVLWHYKPSLTVDDPTFSYAKHLSLMGILGTVASRVDSILIFHYVGPVQLAIYSFAKIIPERIGGLFKSLSTAALPRFATRSEKELRSGMLYKVMLLLIASLITAGLYALVAPYIYRIFFPQYIESIKYSQVLSLTLIASVASIPTTALYALESKKKLYVFNTLNPLIQIGLLFVFVMMYGLWGVVIARLVATAMTIVLSLILIK